MVNESTSRTEVISEVLFLGKLVERIAAGKVRVPRFQRSFVWKQQDLFDLLDSVLRGFPIGSVLVWDTEETIRSACRVGPVEVAVPPDGIVSYLLDGQQRLSTLVGTLTLPSEAHSEADNVDWRIYCDLETHDFVRAPRAGVGAHQFPMSSLLNTTGFFEACRRIERVSDPERRRRWLDSADRLANAFRDYQIPVIHIREAGLETAVTVFARLNRRGRKMTPDEMVSALTYREGDFHLAEHLDGFSDELEGQGFGNLDRVLLLRSVLAALNRDIYAKDWADLMVKEEVRSELPKSFSAAARGMRLAIEFLRTLGVTSDRLLPYGLQLVLLGEFFRLCEEPSAQALGLLRRWFWVTSFTGWFGGVNSAQATRALREIRELARGESAGLRVVDFEVPAQPFPERFDGRSARVRAFLLYLASLAPCELRSSRELDPGALLSTRGTKALGYVSSKSTLLGELSSSPANRMFVPEFHVGQAFSELRDLSEGQLGEVLPRHGFPCEGAGLVRDDDPQQLVEARLRELVRGEREFLRERGVSLPTTETGGTIADSDSSDDEGQWERQP